MFEGDGLTVAEDDPEGESYFGVTWVIFDEEFCEFVVDIVEELSDFTVVSLTEGLSVVDVWFWTFDSLLLVSRLLGLFVSILLVLFCSSLCFGVLAFLTIFFLLLSSLWSTTLTNSN